MGVLLPLLLLLLVGLLIASLANSFAKTFKRRAKASIYMQKGERQRESQIRLGDSCMDSFKRMPLYIWIGERENRRE